jgi:hypothetical protein
MKHSILFSGHMIDAKDRAGPRFPAGKENAAIGELRKYLLGEKEIAKDKLFGIAGGACGGDILFHELCIETGIPTEIYLALPVDEFKEKSVSFAGKGWDRRFDELISKLPFHILSGPGNNDEDKNVWERTNLWMLDLALKHGGKNMTLIALWNGETGDGEGGTKHMVEVAKEQGARVEIIDTNKL